MDIILVILILCLIFGAPLGWRLGGPQWGGGTGGLLVILLVIYLLFGHRLL